MRETDRDRVRVEVCVVAGGCGGEHKERLSQATNDVVCTISISIIRIIVKRKVEHDYSVCIYI